MNILFVNNFRGRGGGEEFLRGLLPGLVAKGIKVGLVCRPATPLVEMFKGSAVSVYPVSRSGYGAITSVFKISRIIREGGYDIINIQRGHDIIQSWIAALLSRKRPKLIYTPHVPEFIRSRFLLRRMDAIATISRYIRDGLTSFEPALSSRITIIYHGIDLGRFNPMAVQRGWLRKRLGLASDTKIIGTVGDLWKNQIEFLDVLALLRERFPEVRYAIVGTDSGSPAVDAFKKRASELGLVDMVLWVGRLSKEDMLSFYADIDLAVSTHRNEGFGIWILEAMAMGRPVVAFNEGGIRDALENCPAGVLVNGGPKEMAAEIVRILKNNEVYERMSGAGPRWISDRFSRERMVEDYYLFFNRLVAT